MFTCINIKQIRTYTFTIKEPLPCVYLVFKLGRPGMDNTNTS